MAATLATPAQQVDSIEPEILTDDQVEKLLQEAENRLRQQAGLVNDPEKDTISFNEEPSTRTKRIQLPNLEHTANKSSYIRTSDGVAKADPKSMVPAEQRKMAGGLRKIQTQRTRNSKVVSHTCILPSIALQHEEITSQTSLDADKHLILRMPCFRESSS